ncbi:hypothetical protein LTR78_007272 [Recurvomyces mirabilis]|uniref:HOOK N-terminal domain-containing protein n=1 Tax=Recurvomyces mirabilis TaxID=574656 RepID=A0AAE1BYX1_9PEZI|nr:hypothetical protein LTR78_007272 [Recurvomyces mirabilis]KAK5155485.1 hypothetical protein LTS14_005746 [Recurvomyces mirabilis]
MESTELGSLGESLLQWVNTFEEGGNSERWENLSDGRRLWRILREVDKDHFSEDLPEPDVGPGSDWTRKWQNLKHIERQLSTYYRDVCNGQEGIASDFVPDLKAAAAETNVRELEKLIMIMIRAAMASPEANQKMAHKLMSLGREKAMLIANELRSMQEHEFSESEPPSRDESAYHSDAEGPIEHQKANGNRGGGAYSDPLLEREEELLQAQVTIDKLQANQAAAQQQLQELRQDKDRLQEAFDAYRTEINSKGRKNNEDDGLKKLQRQAENDRAYIDDLESQMQTSRGSIESYERQIEKRRAEGEASQQLRDDLQMLKAENEELNQKVRANENLKKKIQTLQEQEKANLNLREELKVATERLTDLDRLKQVQASLEKEIIEKKGLIRNQEYQITEATTTRKHAEHDARVLAQKLEAARERHDRDHETLEELRVRLQDSTLDAAVPADTPAEQVKQLVDPDAAAKRAMIANDDHKNVAEKLAMLEQQLEAADARLKQSSQRNATLEEEMQKREQDEEAQRKLAEQASRYESTIAELRQEVEAAAAAAKSQPQKDTPARDLAALQKENRLMTSAWYDLSNRIQQQGVSVGRRRYEPKSWIGKQRQLVGPSVGLNQRS